MSIKCRFCKIKKKGWCSPLKRFQCEHGYSNEEYIRLLILTINDQTNKLNAINKISKGVFNNEKI